MFGGECREKQHGMGDNTPCGSAFAAYERVTMSLKKYQNWLAHYLVSRRDGDHALAAELAGMICGYWEGLGNTVELDKWERVKDEHRAKIT